MFRPAARASWLQYRTTVILLAGASVAASAPYLAKKVQNDVLTDPEVVRAKRASAERLIVSDKEVLERLAAYSWGSGSAVPSASSSAGAVEGPRTPTEAAAFSGVALRDLILHETQNALVDAAGDVYQWESSPNATPKCILKGKIYSLDTASELPVDTKSHSWLSFLWPREDDDVLKTSVNLAKRETFASISAGRDHLLAVTSVGRTFAHPVSLNANSHGQLGTRRVRIVNNGPSDTPRSSSNKLEGDKNAVIELVPKAQADPLANSSPFIRAGENKSNIQSEPRQLVPMLYEVPPLRGVTVAKAVANERSSYVLTKDGGKVLAWGANEYGQLGLGGAVVPVVSVPAEVPLSRSYPGGASVRCVDIAAGGNAAYFAVESFDPQGKTPSFDLLACGMGQYGALGHGSYISAQGTPVKTKVLSGNVLFNEKINSSEAIGLHSLSASPTGHAIASISSGHDLLTWGANTSYQLGNGKRANSAVPTYMRDFSLAAANLPDSMDSAFDRQGRMTLRSGTVPELKDMSGRRVGRNVKVSSGLSLGGMRAQYIGGLLIEEFLFVYLKRILTLFDLMNLFRSNLGYNGEMLALVSGIQIKSI